MSPPSKAPSSAAVRVRVDAPEGAAGGSPLPARAALALSAASSAGDTLALAATAGQGPCTVRSARYPGRGVLPCTRSASTTGKVLGLLLRCSASGMRAVHTSPSHCWVPGAALCSTSGISGNRSSVLPRSAAGSPATRTCRASPSTWACCCALAFASGWGCAFWAASKAALCSAVVLWMGSCRVKWPSSGMHSLRHTSHEALSCTVTSLANGPGAKVWATVTGTGSSTVPS